MFRKYFEEKEKKATALEVVAIVGAIVATVAAAFAVYKVVKEKFKVSSKNPKMLGTIEMDGDDAIMLDTTGDGEVDTIIINED